MDPSSDNSSAVSKRQLADKTIFQHQSSYRTMRWNSKLLFLLLKALKNILDRMLSNSVMKILKENLKLGQRFTIFIKRRKCTFNFISSPQSCSQAIVG